MVNISFSSSTLRNPAQQAPLDLRAQYKAAVRQATVQPDAQARTELLLQQLRESDFDAPVQTSDVAKPQLNAPRIALPTEPGSAKDSFTELVARLLKLFGEVDSVTLNNRLHLLKQMAQGATENWNRLADGHQKALADLEAANAAAEGTGSALEAAQAQLEQAHSKLQAARAKLEGLAPGTPEHDAALLEVAANENAYNQARGQAERAEATHRVALERAGEAAKVADRLARELLDKASGVALPVSVKQAMEREIAAGGKLVVLMMRFVQLMGDAQETKTESEAALFKEIQKSRQADMNKKAEEFERELEKARRAQKAAGCIGKVMMAVTAVVGVVATVASGGMAAGLVVAAMAAATPLLDKALKPVMDAVMSALAPVLEAMMKGVSSLLQEVGVDANTAMLISSVVVSVAIAAAVMGAIALLSAGAGSAIAQKVMAKVGDVASRVVDKLMNSLLGKLMQGAASKVSQNALVQEIRALFRQISQQISGRLSGPNAQASMTHLQTAGQAANFIGAGSSGALKTVGSQHEVNAAERLSDILIAGDAAERAKQALADGVKAAGKAAETISRASQEIVATLQREADTATDIARKIGAHARAPI